MLELEECSGEVFSYAFFYYTVSITIVAGFGHCWKDDFELEGPLVPTYYGSLCSLRLHISVVEADMGFISGLSLALLSPSL